MTIDALRAHNTIPITLLMYDLPLPASFQADDRGVDEYTESSPDVSDSHNITFHPKVSKPQP